MKITVSIIEQLASEGYFTEALQLARKEMLPKLKTKEYVTFAVNNTWWILEGDDRWMN